MFWIPYIRKEIPMYRDMIRLRGPHVKNTLPVATTSSRSPKVFGSVAATPSPELGTRYRRTLYNNCHVQGLGPRIEKRGRLAHFNSPGIDLFQAHFNSPENDLFN